MSKVTLYPTDYPPVRCPLIDHTRFTNCCNEPSSRVKNRTIHLITGHFPGGT